MVFLWLCSYTAYDNPSYDDAAYDNFPYGIACHIEIGGVGLEYLVGIDVVDMICRVLGRQGHDLCYVLDSMSSLEVERGNVEGELIRNVIDDRFILVVRMVILVVNDGLFIYL